MFSEVDLMYQRNGKHNLAFVSEDRATGKATVLKLDLGNPERVRLLDFIPIDVSGRQPKVA